MELKTYRLAHNYFSFVFSIILVQLLSKQPAERQIKLASTAQRAHSLSSSEIKHTQFSSNYLPFVFVVPFAL